MQVGIVAQKGNPRAAYLADDVRETLSDRDVTVWLDEATATALDADGYGMDRFESCDCIVAIGGDGTFLYAAHHAGGTPILGVNLGEVGFLNAISADDAEEAILETVDALQAGEGTVREVPRLVARTDDWASSPATNEIVVQGPRRGRGGGVDYEIRVDGSLYSGGHADGVIVATPTGSTAYNLSERGPIVHPGVETMLVNEMVAEAGMPPLAIPLDRTVSVTLTGVETGVVVSDGRDPKELSVPVEIAIERSGPPMRMAGPSPDFFEALGKLS